MAPVMDSSGALPPNAMAPLATPILRIGAAVPVPPTPTELSCSRARSPVIVWPSTVSVAPAAWKSR